MMHSAKVHCPSPYQLTLHTEPGAELLAFVRQQFSRHHAASIDSLMPWQCSLRDGKQALVASVGLRSAAFGPLFLEHYLEAPIEQQLAQALQQPVARDEILEVGNLAATSGHARLLFLSMARYLASQRFRYVVFTATDKVQEIIQQLGLSPIHLAQASAERVPDASVWGSYYQRSPMVLAGEIKEGWRHLQTLPAVLDKLCWLPESPAGLPREVR